MKSKTYEEFVEKFKPKKTTDDCMTPQPIYDVVRDWACKEYGIDPDCIVRPFWPGGDYERYDYPDGCVVLDNPPFSILARICTFYIDRGIPFFLFAPSLTAFSGKQYFDRINHIICDCKVTYENGAVVRTSFVTSYGDGIVAQTSPELTKAVNAAVKALRKEKVKSLPKYEYPAHIVTAAIMQRYAHYGISFGIHRGEYVRVPRLDAQRETGKAIFGSGLLLSDKKAAERAAAERAAAERAAAERAAAAVWELSDRERAIVGTLG